MNPWHLDRPLVAGWSTCHKPRPLLISRLKCFKFKKKKNPYILQQIVSVILGTLWMVFVQVLIFLISLVFISCLNDWQLSMWAGPRYHDQSAKRWMNCVYRQSANQVYCLYELSSYDTADTAADQAAGLKLRGAFGLRSSGQSQWQTDAVMSQPTTLKLFSSDSKLTS